MGKFDGEGAAQCKVYGHSVVLRCGKTAELIDMPFEMWTLVDTRNHVLDGVQIVLCEEVICSGNGMPGHARQHSAVRCAKMAQPIEIPFGLWTRMGPRKHVLDVVHTGATY